MSRKPAFRQRMIDAVEIGEARGFDEVTILPDGTVRLRKTANYTTNEAPPEVDGPNEIDEILAARRKLRSEAKSKPEVCEAIPRHCR